MITGTTAAQYSLSMPMTSVGARVSLNVVNPARSANRTLTSRSSPPSCATAGSRRRIRWATTDGRYGPERRVETAQFAGGLCQERDLVARGALATEVGQYPFSRALRARPLQRPPRSPWRASGRPGQGCFRGTARRRPKSSEPLRRYSFRAPSAMAANANSISRCHSHQLRCQFRLTATATMASASRTNATAIGERDDAAAPPIEPHVPPGR